MHIALTCCPLCGRAMQRDGEAGTDYLPRQGIHLSIAFYFRGIGGAGDKIRFHDHACGDCAADLRKLLEPAILYIQEREIGR